jgi:branched-chain amino acid transport system permease protein
MAMIAAFSFAGGYTFFRGFLPAPFAVIASGFGAALGTAAVSCLGYRLLLHPLRDSAKVKALIVSLGFSIVLQNLVLLLISSSDLPFPLQTEQYWKLGSITIGKTQLWVIISSMMTWLVAYFVVYRTRLGRAIRAVAQSRDGAWLMGIPVNRIVMLTFGFGAMTAAISGILLGAYNGTMRFDMGFLPGIKGFIAAILGGVGNVRGALLAGILLGLSEGFFSGYISSDYRDVFSFGLLILILLVRPHGLLGEGT